MNPVIYLSGAISGQTLAEAGEWRQDAKQLLPLWISTSDPLRGKDFLSSLGVLGSRGHGDNPMASDRGVHIRDRFDVKNCSLMIVYLKGTEKVSIGTMIEVGWADAYDKPIILVMEPEGAGLEAYEHAILLDTAGYIVESLEEACHLAATLLEPYRPVQTARQGIPAQTVVAPPRRPQRARQAPQKAIQPSEPVLPVNPVVPARPGAIQAATDLDKAAIQDKARLAANTASLRSHARLFQQERE